MGSPASATPATDGKRIFVFFGSFGLLSYDTAGGLLWSKPMGPFQDKFGASSSPVLADGKVILNEDHDIDSYLIAVNVDNGKTVWKEERPAATRSYSTPVPYEENGQPRLLVAGSLRFDLVMP